MFARVLIANRAEIAVRVARTCRELGVGVVAVYSDADSRSRHRDAADEAVHLPGVAPADTYGNVAAIVDAARLTAADAVHPGYGFLAESPDLANAVVEAGLAWVGPPPEALSAVGDKVVARRMARRAGIAVVPGTLEPLGSVDELRAFGAEHGYPLAVKAAGGGGGRGLKVASDADEVSEAFASARREARAYFGSADVYVERYLESPKHLEVQVLAPEPDDALWLGVRDCSLQRGHQKLVEETPVVDGARSDDMGAAAVALCKECGYSNAGTVEMLVDRDGSFYFLEMNARLQVEHTVTEEVFGIDLVACQLRIAAGEPLGFSQGDLEPRGHAIECRINAEDPGRGWAPSPGVIRGYSEPGGPGVRVDSGYAAGDEVPEAYDSLVAKLVAWGATREEARRRMLRALDEMRVDGVATTIPAHKLLLGDEEFVAGSHDTTTVRRCAALDRLATGGRSAADVRLWHPTMAESVTRALTEMGGGQVIAPMQGTILDVRVTPGQRVDAGDVVVVLEAMKMETPLVAPVAGMIAALHAAEGDTTEPGRILATIE